MRSADGRARETEDISGMAARVCMLDRGPRSAAARCVSFMNPFIYNVFDAILPVAP